jgi:hypothetical protein
MLFALRTALSSSEPTSEPLGLIFYNIIILISLQFIARKMQQQIFLPAEYPDYSSR